MTRNMQLPIGIALVLTLSSLLLACNFSRFDELEEQAPVNRHEQAGNESSRYGRIFLSLDDSEPGGRIVSAGGGGSPAINVTDFQADGGIESEQTTSQEYEEDLDLQGVDAMSMAEGPTGPINVDDEQLNGPFIYIGAHDDRGDDGRVVLADVSRFLLATTLRPDLGTQSGSFFFGAAVTGATFSNDAEAREDVIVGGHGRVWLFRPTNFPSDYAQTLIEDREDVDWPPSSEDDSLFSSVVAGNLDQDEDDEVIVAAPGAAFVAILPDPEACATDPETCPIDVLDPPEGDTASRFGQSLLLADLDDDDELELLVGAPNMGDSGAVYLYDDLAADPTEIGAPAGAAGFGNAIAFGRLDATSRSLIGIGAPDSRSTDDDLARSGKTYFFSNDGESLISTVELLDPEEGGELGDVLSAMPFQGDTASADLLVSNGPQALLIFFANTTPEHEDPRTF